ncbi:hypothetical protein Micbo1qcDRAFT_209285 [Microdochium bolleyi]|uniref:Uncharacterized protein n=1 Tax=Microdochium bolleyi TaxID=196109 RepID=A0A136IMD7_9PEZI|nr:hypothetical protein Micbo1qcDRAFT_209285 [Microdochium bolleyi]
MAPPRDRPDPRYSNYAGPLNYRRMEMSAVPEAAVGDAELTENEDPDETRSYAERAFQAEVSSRVRRGAVLTQRTGSNTRAQPSPLLPRPQQQPAFHSSAQAHQAQQAPAIPNYTARPAPPLAGGHWRFGKIASPDMRCDDCELTLPEIISRCGPRYRSRDSGAGVLQTCLACRHNTCRLCFDRGNFDAEVHRLYWTTLDWGISRELPTYGSAPGMAVLPPALAPGYDGLAVAAGPGGLGVLAQVASTSRRLAVSLADRPKRTRKVAVPQPADHVLTAQETSEDDEPVKPSAKCLRPVPQGPTTSSTGVTATSKPTRGTGGFIVDASSENPFYTGLVGVPTISTMRHTLAHRGRQQSYTTPKPAVAVDGQTRSRVHHMLSQYQQLDRSASRDRSDGRRDEAGLSGHGNRPSQLTFATQGYRDSEGVIRAAIRDGLATARSMADELIQNFEDDADRYAGRDGDLRRARKAVDELEWYWTNHVDVKFAERWTSLRDALLYFEGVAALKFMSDEPFMVAVSKAWFSGMRRAFERHQDN